MITKLYKGVYVKGIEMKAAILKSGHKNFIFLIKVLFHNIIHLLFFFSLVSSGY